MLNVDSFHSSRLFVRRINRANLSRGRSEVACPFHQEVLERLTGRETVSYEDEAGGDWLEQMRLHAMEAAANLDDFAVVRNASLRGYLGGLWAPEPLLGSDDVVVGVYVYRSD